MRVEMRGRYITTVFVVGIMLQTLRNSNPSLMDDISQRWM